MERRAAGNRNFPFTGEMPLINQTILFIDDITPEKGPTLLVPGSHRNPQPPPDNKRREPLEDEIAVPVPAGSAILIHTAPWHSAGQNTTDQPRRGIYLEYGYWWLERYYYPGVEMPLPWQALEGASKQRLCLLGLRMPGSDLHADGR